MPTRIPMIMQELPADKNSFGFLETADIETSSEEYACRFSGKIGEYFLHVQSKITLDLLKPYPHATILDLGGGHAQLALPLVNHGYQVTVTGSADICRERLDKLLPSNRYKYLTCDMLDLPFEDHHFDVVIAFRLLPHVGRWQQLISEMCRVSKEIIIFDYPDRRSFNFYYGMLFAAKKAVEKNTRPFRLFNRGEIKKELENNCYTEHTFKPQFFIPMVIHRVIHSVPLTRIVEFFFMVFGITKIFGSPVIVKSVKKQKPN